MSEQAIVAETPNGAPALAATTSSRPSLVKLGISPTEKFGVRNSKVWR